MGVLTYRYRRKIAKIKGKSSIARSNDRAQESWFYSLLVMTLLRRIRCWVLMVVICLWVAIWGVGLFIAALFKGRQHGFMPRSVRILAGPINWMCGIEVTIENEHRLYETQPSLFLANHQSGFDVPIYGKFCPPNIVWMVKKELGALPLIGGVIRKTGNILIDRKNREKAYKQLQEAAVTLREQRKCVAIMPEGTRNPNGDKLLPFKRGPFHLAAISGIPMLPMVCSSLRHVAHVKSGHLGGKAVIRVLPPVFPKGTPEQMSKELYALMQKAFEDLNRELGYS